MKTIFRRTLFILSIILICLMVLPSCGQRKIGWALLLWSHDEDIIPTGTLVPIYAESKINETYTIGTGDDELILELPKWRFSFFQKKNEAEKAAEDYEAAKNLYARVERAALRVRDEPSATAQQLYKLRQDEIIKVVDRPTEKVNISGLEGYWYKVLTEEGIVGYCFDYYLTVYDNVSGEIIGEKRVQEDTALNAFLQTVWRPVHFKEMIDQGRINLELLNPAYGVFPDPDNETIRINTVDHSVSFEYENIQKVGSNHYIVEGTSLQLFLWNAVDVGIQFAVDNEEISLSLTRIDQNIRSIIAQELDRRNNLFRELVRQGNRLYSNAYGTIQMDSQMNFTWSGFRNLTNQGIIPADAGRSGKLSFHVFLGNKIQSLYDGVISFQFEKMDKNSYIHFLYSVTDSGIQFRHLPDSMIENNLATGESMNPLVIFFSYL